MAVQTQATTSDVSLCSRADELGQSKVPLQLVSGWLDSTAAAAINLYHYCGQAPGKFVHYAQGWQVTLAAGHVTYAHTLCMG